MEFNKLFDGLKAIGDTPIFVDNEEKIDKLIREKRILEMQLQINPNNERIKNRLEKIESIFQKIQDFNLLG